MFLVSTTCLLRTDELATHVQQDVVLITASLGLVVRPVVVTCRLD